MDAVIYVRWSSAEQSRGSSLERQLGDCQRHAAMKGWKVVEEPIIEDGISAFKGANLATGKLGAFAQRVEAGEYPNGVILLTERLDRLSREGPKAAISWLWRVNELGVTVCTVDGDRRYESANFDMAAIMEVLVKASVANDESEKKSQRVAAAWAGKRGRLASGDKAVMTKRAPGWLEVAGSPPTFNVIEERAAIVRRIFDETVAGLGKHVIARNLNNDRIAPFGRADGWHASYVQKILASKAVLGEFQPGRKVRGEARTTAGDPISDYYPAIIDADLHARAMASMAGRWRGVAGRGRRLANLLSGLGRCDTCQGKMTFRGKGLKQRASGEWVSEDYLVCDGYQRGKGCTNKVHFIYQMFEDSVLDAVMHHVMKEDVFADPREERKLEVEIAERTRVLDAIKIRADRALTAFVDDNDDGARALRVKLLKNAEAEAATIKGLKSQLAKAKGRIPIEVQIERIREVRAAMADDDEDVRFAARSKVMAALSDLIRVLWFSEDSRSVRIVLRDDKVDPEDLHDDKGWHAIVMRDGRVTFGAASMLPFKSAAPYQP